jgi:predicted MFS family arabinose efflux permease
MRTNPVERNFVTRFVMGLAVIVGMFLGGGAGGWLLGSVGVAYAGVLGTLLGSAAVFVAFTAWYRRYDAAWAEE